MIIKQAEFSRSSDRVSQCPDDNLPEFAFIGRSNVGKSSLINALVNNKNLCKTSSTPGKTRLINHFLINKEWYIVDLPGYGFAKVPQSERNKIERMISSYIIDRKQLRKLFILLDSRHEMMKIDSIFIDNVLDLNLPVAFVLTKCDKLSNAAVDRSVASFQKLLTKLFDGRGETSRSDKPEIIPTSAERKSGIDTLLNSIETALTTD